MGWFNDVDTMIRDDIRGKNPAAPRPPQPAPAPQADQQVAQQRAAVRQQAVMDQRFGYAQTVRTSPTGLSSQPATTTNKRLLGE